MEVRFGREMDMNCIDILQAHGGSYSIYYALAVASKEIKVDHRYGPASIVAVSEFTISTREPRNP